MLNETLDIAYLQTNIINHNTEANIQHIETLINTITTNIDLIILPETFNTGSYSLPNINAEQIDGITVKWLHKLAHERNCIICGSIILNIDNKNYNSFIWMRPEGTYDIYNKRHTFRMSGESQYITRGNNYIILELISWKIRPFICYDLRFPVWSRNRNTNYNFEYDVAVYVANWPASRSYIWKQLLIARSIENVSYTIGVNRVGYDIKGQEYCGDSMIIDAQGKIISQTAKNQENIIIYTLDKERLDEFRKKFQVVKDWDEFILSKLS